jgi:drug/metabolite transporter (DMT)-like permease
MSAITASRSSINRVGASDLGPLLFLGAMWGGVFLFTRVAAPEVGAIWTATVRIGLAAIVLIAVAGRATIVSARGRIRQIAFVGATFSMIPYTLIAFAALTLPASMGALLNAATPIFTALVAAVWLGQPVNRRVVAGLAAGAAAVVALVGLSPIDLGPGTVLAVIAALGATLSYAVAGSFIKRYLSDVRPVELATGQLTIGALLMLPLAILSGPPGIPSLGGAMSLVALALPATALAWPVFITVLGRRGPTAASTVTFIVPAFGILWASIGLGERIGPGLVVGFGLIALSLVLILGIRAPKIHLPATELGRRVRLAVHAAA